MECMESLDLLIREIGMAVGCFCRAEYPAWLCQTVVVMVAMVTLW